MNYKDCQEWKKVGFPLSTTSNEAAKMYDAVVTQYMGGYIDDSVGDIGTCLKKMFMADPEFALGHAVKNGLMLLAGGASARTNSELKNGIDKMVALAQKADITPLEKLHVEAVKLYSVGQSAAASDKWEEILLHYPTDFMAVQNAFMAHLLSGNSERIRDCYARILPHWEDLPSITLKSTVRSLYAFGLEETNFYDEAEKIAREVLEVSPKDGHATHTISHVLEMMNRCEEGVTFSQRKEKDFKNHFLAGHIYWHWGLFHIEKGDYEAALTLYDEQLEKFMGKDKPINLIDASSLLYRLELEGVNVGDRWKEVHKRWTPRIGDHAHMFDDIHSFMATQGAEQDGVAANFIESLRDFVNNADDRNGNARVSKEVGLPLCEAFNAYSNGDYGTAVDIMTPIRYRIQEIGGSHAQRDVFNLFLIHAALKSSEQKHQLLARSLLQERQARRKCSPMIDRILAQLGDISNN